MFSRRTVLAGLASLPVSLALPSMQAQAATSNLPLHAAAAQSRRFFGTCVRMDQLDKTPTLKSEVLAQCNSVTPEIHLKWNSVENKRGQFWFEPVDRMIKFAQANNLRVHGHTLIWEQSTPGWAVKALRKNKDWAPLGEHIERVVTRYRDSIGQWDVVNEPIDTQNGVNGLRQNTFHRAFGPGYIERALTETHQHAPQARLMLNDYGFEYENYVERDRRAAFLKLLEGLKKKGVPLHGVGIQAHLDLGKGDLKAKTIGGFLQRIADMGLAIVITELDVKERDYRAPIETRDQRVSDEVRRYLDIALDQRAVEGVTTWGMSDRYSWLQVEAGDRVGSSKAINRGLPYDTEFKPKAMYASLREALARG